MTAKPNIVVLGGGNGTSRLLTALLPLVKDGTVAAVHALVHMADDGGSTGRLRRQYGVAAIGDLTKCLVALSGWQGDIRGDAFLQALDYRYTSGDFEGHTLRNMFLTSLEKTSDLDSAIATMARILQLPQNVGVVPVTLTTLHQQVEIQLNGQKNVLGEGEHFIAHHVNLQADPHWKPGDVRVTFAEKDMALNPRALELVRDATHILVAPGHTYGSILPTLALPSLGKAVAASSAQLWIVMTLLTTPRQTTGWRGEDFVRVYAAYLNNRRVDGVIGNSGEALISLVAGQEWVRFHDEEHEYRLVQDNIVNTERVGTQAGDAVPRAIATHNSDKLETLFRGILTE